MAVKKHESIPPDIKDHGVGCTCSKCTTSTSGNGGGGLEGSDMIGGDDDDGDGNLGGTRKQLGLKARNNEVIQSTKAGTVSSFSPVVLSYMNHASVYTDSVDAANAPINDGRSGLTDLANRILTFRFWPKPDVATGKELARCGFYYLNDRDRVKCVHCNLILKNWESGDDPTTEHKKFSPYCQFEQYMAMDSPTSNPLTEPSLGISYDRPKFPDHAVEYNRLKTFTSWPCNKDQTIEDMAKAGFFFVGQPDRVMCFYCGLKLHNWLEGDEPWFEHARYGAQCTYVRHCKGQDFATQVKEAAERGLRHLEPKVTIPPNPAKKQKCNIEEYINTPSVRSLLEIMMVPKENVLKALTKCLEKSDKCPDAATLMEYVYQIEDEEEAAECKAETADSHEVKEESNVLSSKSAHNGACGTLADENVSRNTLQVTFPTKSSEIRNSPSAPTGGLLASTQTLMLPNEEVHSVMPAPLETTTSQKNPDEVTENHRPKVLLSKEDTEDDTYEDEDEDIYGDDIGQSQIQHQRRQLEEEELVKIRSENEELQQERRCKICLDEVASILFLPCGHLVCCSTCSPAVRLCPICRKLIQGTVKTFRV